ncbi:MAG: Crp/Fnr family transcriptional regulator [Anaerolineae bacterium]|nr:Crp/Fnr family transcriptional regulator [Anaerolineae bacterium]MDQ7035347.1 Crp/Fnr family transcriptional regulator [Anaerolineae bacterium]
MIKQEQFSQLVRILPLIQRLNPQMKRDFQQIAYYARIPSGRDIFAQGDDVDAIALLLSGAVRVYKISESGREITLYRFSSGESCILTANAILNNQSFAALATVEEDAEAIMIPAATFRHWVNQHELWREFVFGLLSQRLARVIEIVDEVAFGRMDIRVAKFLIERTEAQNPLITTHQEIAAELGSSREVISRILSSLASQGFIQMERGSIEVVDSQLLRDYALR